MRDRSKAAVIESYKNGIQHALAEGERATAPAPKRKAWRKRR